MTISIAATWKHRGDVLAKRFTDTAKWDKAWFRKLSPPEKCVWMFLCDRCDHAGFWDIDMDALHFFVGTTWRIEDLTSTFGDKITLVGKDKIFIPDFVEFQYGNLNPKNRVHNSIIQKAEKLLKKKGRSSPLKAPSNGAMEMDMEMDMEMEKEKDPAKILFDAWNENRGQLPEAEKLTDERRSKARSQFKKYPDLAHWLTVLERWKASEFCTVKWRPTIDDWLKENKRTVTLEGKYDDRGSLSGDGRPQSISEILKTEKAGA